MHCLATIYGGMAAPNTGVMAFQTTSAHRRKAFCVAATGVVLELDRSFKIVKKLRLVGHPYVPVAGVFGIGSFVSSLFCFLLFGFSVIAGLVACRVSLSIFLAFARRL
jgi:hypothetical protein